MERLTRNNRGFFELCEDTRTCNKICEENEECTDECVIQKAINKLGEYEDLEEQGLLLRLPCKVGDTVYTIRKYSYCPSGICHKDISCSECRDRSPFGIYKKKFALKDSKEIGKTIFLTKEEAEQALNDAKKGA